MYFSEHREDYHSYKGFKIKEKNIYKDFFWMLFSSTLHFFRWKLPSLKTEASTLEDKPFLQQGDIQMPF